MGLPSALVDKARVVAREATGRKVEGTSMMTPTFSEWFKARLMLQNAPERGEQGERKKKVATPQMMCGVKDLSGGKISHDQDDSAASIVLRGDVVIEVDSPQLGQAKWNVRGEPAPIRKKRRVIGYVVDLERVVENRRQGVRP